MTSAKVTASPGSAEGADRRGCRLAVPERPVQTLQVIPTQHVVQRLPPARNLPPFAEARPGPDGALAQLSVLAELDRLRDGEERAYLRVLLEKEPPPLARLLLPPAKGGKRDVVVGAGDRLGTVDDPHSQLRHPVGHLDVLPRGMREGRVEEPGRVEERLRQRDVRGVEEVERHRFTVLDQGVAELEAVLVDVVEKRRDPPVPRPLRVAEDGGRQEA